jgi:hypothetical protein
LDAVRTEATIVLKKFFVRFRLTLLLVGTVLVFSILFGTYRSNSICDVCGASLEETQFQVIFVGLPFWITSREVSTPLSAAAMSNGWCPPHKHTWLFASGSGNGIMCSIGQGRHIRNAAMNDDWVKFLSAVDQYRDKATAIQWMKESLVPSQTMQTIVISGTLPEKGFADQAAFERWWKDVAIYREILTAEK